MSQKVVERPRQSVGSYYLGAQNKIKTNIDMIFQMLVSNSTIDENAGNQRLMNEFHFIQGPIKSVCPNALTSFQMTLISHYLQYGHRVF